MTTLDPVTRSTAGTVEYGLITGLIYLSASPMVFQSPLLRLGLTCFILLTAGWIALRRGSVISFGTLLTGLALFALVLSTPLLTGDPDSSPYIAIAISIVIAALVSSAIGFDRFAVVYTKIAIVLAALSLVFMGIGAFWPRLLSALPMVAGEHVDYRFAGVYVYLMNRQAGAVGTLVERNSGMAWEPAAFAILMCLAALLLVHRHRGAGLSRSSGVGLGILAAAILATYSSTGLLLFLLIVVGYFHTVFVSPKAGIATLAALVTVQLVGFSDSSLLVWERYVNPSNADATLTNLAERVSLDKIGAVMEAPFFPLGSSYEWLHATQDRLWSSILASAIALGAVFVLILAYQYIRFVLIFRRTAWIVAMFLVVAFSSENFMVSPLFLLLAAYGSASKPASDLGVGSLEAKSTVVPSHDLPSLLGGGDQSRAPVEPQGVGRR